MSARKLRWVHGLAMVGGGMLTVGATSCAADGYHLPPLELRDDPQLQSDGSVPATTDDGHITSLADAAATSGSIYLNAARSLYLFDPVRSTLERVGDVSCPGFVADDELMDIAIDRDGHVLATSFGPADVLESYFFSVDPQSGTCHKIATNVGLPVLGLAFVPRGVLDPANDVLVGYSDDTYVRFDTKTGKQSIVGKLNAPGAAPTYRINGDLVVLPNGTAYATGYRVGRASSDPDVLVRIDPRTGNLLGVAGPLYGEHVTGLAMWAGHLYGVSRNGILEIDPATAKSFPKRPASQFDAGSVSFSGAGATTVAPEH